MRSFSISILLFICAYPLGGIHAQPFDQCPGTGYLVQGSNARVYGVNLATGYYQLLSDDLGTSAKVNAIGFSVHDRYIYGYANEWNSLIRINSLFQSEPLVLRNAPNTSFFVGDVSLAENKYYAYRPGADFGLYYVDLDDQSIDYLSYTRIIDGSRLNLAIYDFAFHPTQNVLYAVDRNGQLLTIDPQTGSFQVVSNVGQSGTFGAVYFDAAEYFYISRNSDGHIYRINLKDDSPSAEFFAYGPSSSNNDGARCATANIISDEGSVDFGNAPASYGSNIEGNGARHEVSENLHIGSSWGGEDDGVEFVTNIEPGLSSIVVAQVKGEGFLNAWGDWNKNGSFEDSEQFIKGQKATDGSNFIRIDVPSNALPGETWSRIRYSTQVAIGANGGVADGEVEDYKIDVIDAGTSVVHYPSNSGYVTIAFEDNWPVMGDYDMNDVVVAMRSSQYISPQQNTLRYEVQGKFLALGAGYHNGFAIQFDGISTSAIDEENSQLFINGALQDMPALEENSEADDAVFIVESDLKSSLPAQENCVYYRTERNCEAFEGNDEINFALIVSLKELVHVDNSPTDALNPFIFATPGTYHGDSFAYPPGRELEIHLKNKKVSSRFNSTFMGLADDRSQGDGTTFVTEKGMPWALEIPGVWSHPLERQDLLTAYPQFKGFVESSSREQKTWYTKENRTPKLVVVNEVEN